MTLWHYRIAIALLLGATAGIIATAFVPSWDRTVRDTFQSAVQYAAQSTPPAPAAPIEPEPSLDLTPKKCRRTDAVTIEETYLHEPRPELSIRTDSKIGRAVPIYIALIVDKNGNVECAEALSGHEHYRAPAAALAMEWRFKPFLRNGEPVVAQGAWPMDIRWLDRRPPKREAFPPNKDWNSLRITFHRSMCFGTCPNYKVTIAGDGTVEYQGGAFVALLGRHQSRVPKETVERLVDQFRRADFFWLNNVYAAKITDNPSYTLELSFDGQTKRVRDYIGLQVGMPDVVRDLQNDVDEISDVERWTKGNKNTAPSLLAEGWNFRSRTKENLTIVAGLAAYGDPDALRAVIALGAPITAKAKARQDYFADEPKTALDAAVSRGDPEILKILLESGASWTRADLNKALLAAAEYGRISIVAPLIKAGADPHYVSPSNPESQRTQLFDASPGSGLRTVLMNAAGSGAPDVVEVVLKARPNVNARDDASWTALHFATQHFGRRYRDAPAENRPRVIELLIAAGADVNARTATGNTPLRLARDDKDATAALIKGGAK